jgi:hypothetical protein
MSSHGKLLIIYLMLVISISGPKQGGIKNII